MDQPYFQIQTPEKLLKATDVASILNISRAMAYRLMQQGEIPSVCIGSARRVRREDLVKYIEKNISPQPESPLAK